MLAHLFRVNARRKGIRVGRCTSIAARLGPVAVTRPSTARPRTKLQLLVIRLPLSFVCEREKR